MKSKLQRLSIFGFLLFSLIIAPWLIPLAKIYLGMRQPLLFMLSMGCVGLVMVPLLGGAIHDA